MTPPAQLAEALHERGFALTHAVRLTQFGRQKISVIKTVRELTGWGLKDAKDAVEGLATILESVGRGAAEDAANKLRDAGAEVEISIGELHLYAFDPNDPRRGGQPIERLRVLGSGFALEHGQLGNWIPKAITPLAPELLLSAIDQCRDAWAQAGKLESTSEIAILERVSAREHTLEDRLRSSDGAARTHEAAVYSDWLQTQGDPRGAIPLSSSSTLPEWLVDARLEDLERTASVSRSHLFGPSLALMNSTSVAWLGPVLDTLVLETSNQHGQLEPPLSCEQLAELLATPVCACLRSLVVQRSIGRDAELGELLSAAACASGLRSLRVTGTLDAGLRGDAFVRLESLTIHGRVTLGPAKLPALRMLDVRIVAPLAPLAASFVQLDTPALEHLTIAVLTHEYWDQNYGPLQANLFELLSQPAFARLRTLSITGGPMLIGFAGLLARLPAITTLEQIDLREADMTPECRTELERSRDRLPGLLL